jgi:hypothetical protein
MIAAACKLQIYSKPGSKWEKRLEAKMGSDEDTGESSHQPDEVSGRPEKVQPHR